MTTLHVPRTVAYVLLGSNIKPEQNLAQAVKFLRQLADVKEISSVYQTSPQGYSEQDDYLNMAVCLMTPFPIDDFKTLILGYVENQLGRERDPQNINAPRTIDLDIALWGNSVLDYGAKPWHVPNPDILAFAHAALPLAEIAPDHVHPEAGQTLKEIAGKFGKVAYHIRTDLQFEES
jgi:2-amino-4-hydroxy-6-hydroxymethyldihydropteridine diphosphokinase